MPQIYAEEKRVRQILLNLISNAAKFTHEGSITVRARRRPSNPITGEGPHAQIDVIDTGIGIARENMGALFEAFRQVDGSTTRQVGGTGLGLPITKDFVELHGGRIWVESEVGEGATFSFTMPFHPVSDEETEVIVSEGVDEGQPVILAVDDEPRVLELYQRYLESGGFAMFGLSNANDIVEHVRNVEPLAVIMDLNMPGKDGWDAISELKKDDATRDIPVIICSINDERQRGFNAGASEYLTKPILEEDLIHALGQIVGGASKEEVYSILVVDSDVTYAEGLSQMLAETGQYSVRSVNVGYEALQTIYEDRPDIVIMDIDLPDMDGYSLIVSMRSHEATRDVPIVIVTSRELNESELERIDGKTNQYIQKGQFDGIASYDVLSSALTAAVGNGGHV